MMNAAKEIADSLHDVRYNLEKLEFGLEQETDNFQVREQRNTRNDVKLEELLMKQKEIVYFNVAGKIYPCNLQMILDFPYENTLKEICEKHKSSWSLDELKKHTIDTNRRVFKIVIDLMRKSEDKRKRISGFYDNVERIEYCLDPEKVNHIVFREELAYYFKGEAFEKIFEDFKILYYLDKSKSVRKVMHGNRINPTNFIQNFAVSAEFPNDLLTPYKAKKIEEITAFDSFLKAIFTDYDSNIVFNFSEPVRVKSIEVKPFWADLDVWFPGDGANALVYYSMDKVNWEFLTMVPDTYGSDIAMTHIMEFEEKELQYLKFELKDYPISISYIKLG